MKNNPLVLKRKLDRLREDSDNLRGKIARLEAKIKYVQERCKHKKVVEISKKPRRDQNVFRILVISRCEHCGEIFRGNEKYNGRPVHEESSSS